MRLYVLLGVLLGSALLLAACGPGAATTATQPAATKPIEVQVTMTEFKIESSLTSFKPNTPYRFVVKNAGTLNHDFSISPPVMAGMAGMDVENAHEDALAVIDASAMPPGASKTIDLTFSKPYSSSEIEFACHTPGHYEAGMRVPITVTQ